MSGAVPDDRRRPPLAAGDPIRVLPRGVHARFECVGLPTPCVAGRGGVRRRLGRAAQRLPVVELLRPPLVLVRAVARPPRGGGGVEHRRRDRTQGRSHGRDLRDGVEGERRLPGHRGVDGCAERGEQIERIGPRRGIGHCGALEDGDRCRDLLGPVHVRAGPGGRPEPARSRTRTQRLCDRDAERARPRSLEEVVRAPHRHVPILAATIAVALLREVSCRTGVGRRRAARSPRVVERTCSVSGGAAEHDAPWRPAPSGSARRNTMSGAHPATRRPVTRLRPRRIPPCPDPPAAAR